MCGKTQTGGEAPHVRHSLALLSNISPFGLFLCLFRCLSEVISALSLLYSFFRSKFRRCCRLTSVHEKIMAAHMFVPPRLGGEGHQAGR